MYKRIEREREGGGDRERDEDGGRGETYGGTPRPRLAMFDCLAE